jgi:folate-binding protein YgfZ
MKEIDSETLPVGQALLDRFEAGEIYIPLADLTWLEIAGDDRTKILSNITTNQIATLRVGQGCETFITDARGKTFGHGLVYAAEQSLRIVTVPDQFERLAAQIDRYVIREQVQVDDRTAAVYSVFWPGQPGCRLARKWQLEPATRPALAVHQRQLDDLPVTVYQVPWATDDDWLLVVDREHADQLDALLVQHDILPGHASLLHCARIRNRYPWFGIDCQVDNLPQEMDRDDRAISFKKGCYLGQETIARLDALGQVQKKLMLWQFAGNQVPGVGTELVADGKTVATVTSSSYCFEADAPIALAITRRSHFRAGSTATCDVGEATVV